MIHLDTNFLIGITNFNASTVERSKRWLQGGEAFALSAVAWSEFLTGPLTDAQKSSAETLIGETILPFGIREAQQAALLYNQIGRKRDRRIDCMIAATAICARAALATQNIKDFAPFVPLGLQLA